ncbi:histidine phosphatase family protein [soil metagenome]
MRHAKSSWDDSSLRDIERPLNKRGKRDAPAMGNYLKKLGVVPDHIISSPAQRARQTVFLLSDVFELNRDAISWNEDLYYKGVEAYTKAIRKTPSKAETILLAGHNPTIEHVVAHLSADRTREVITTANIACFESRADTWSGVGPVNCTFKWLVRPNDLE